MSEDAFCHRGYFMLSAFSWIIQQSAWSEIASLFSAVYNSRVSQLNEQGLMAFTIDPITSIFDWCPFVQKCNF
jgi:predicted XRE-type DNA-binding protein